MALEKVINSFLFYRCSVRLSERVQFFDQELGATTTTDLSNEETLTEGDDDVFTAAFAAITPATTSASFTMDIEGDTSSATEAVLGRRVLRKKQSRMSLELTSCCYPSSEGEEKDITLGDSDLEHLDPPYIPPFIEERTTATTTTTTTTTKTAAAAATTTTAASNSSSEDSDNVPLASLPAASSRFCPTGNTQRKKNPRKVLLPEELTAEQIKNRIAHNMRYYRRTKDPVYLQRVQVLKDRRRIDSLKRLSVIAEEELTSNPEKDPLNMDDSEEAKRQVFLNIKEGVAPTITREAARARATLNIINLREKALQRGARHGESTTTANKELEDEVPPTRRK